MAVLEHRVGELEQTPNRIHSLENSVTQLEVQFETVRSDIHEIKQEGRDTQKLVQKLGEDIRRLFFIGTVVASIAAILVTGLKIYDGWLSIRDRPPATGQHTTGK